MADLDPYWGEFLVSPIPMEASFDYCKYVCAYCFANLNQPGRKANLQAIMNLIAHCAERDTPAARLLRDGYPICISNKVDPFAPGNVQAAIPIMQVLTEIGVPLQIQTKGGRERDVDSLLSFLPPSVFYVSIAMLDDDLRRRIEPGAPRIGDRLRLLAKLSASGHRVVVGVNPLVPDWLPDPQPLLEQVQAAGAEGVWIERLHLSHRQIGRMKERERAAIGDAVLARARLRIPAPADRDALRRARETAGGLGLSVFSIGQPTVSDFFAPYEQLYPQLFPTMQGFVNHCAAEGWQDRLISFTDFCAYLEPQLPAWRGQIGHYIGAVARAVGREQKLPAVASYHDVLKIIWQDSRVRQCPARMACFAFAADWDGDGWLQLVDEAGLPLLKFMPGGTDDYFVQA